MDRNFWRGKRVFLTGHTGFKGSWLALWLTQLGARVTGYSLLPPTEPNHYDLLKLDIHSVIGDIRDADKMEQALREASPEIIFHLAAQSLVRRSFQDPVETFASNVMGTVNLFEAARNTPSVRALVNVTSDKCYENKEQSIGYKENDFLGGYDPYSASKGCSELVTSSWRNSFFNIRDFGKKHNLLLASTRAGNVIGGGDWAEDRLVPDIVKAAHKGEKVVIRNFRSTRPWQHVLEPLSGYLLLGQKLLEGRKEFAEAWNFGPLDDGDITVGDVLAQIRQAWPGIDYELSENPDQPHEAGLLKLNCSKAREKMQWIPVWDGKTAIEKTACWYKMFYESAQVKSQEDLQSYITDANNKNLLWTRA